MEVALVKPLSEADFPLLPEIENSYPKPDPEGNLMTAREVVGELANLLFPCGTDAQVRSAGRKLAKEIAWLRIALADRDREGGRFVATRPTIGIQVESDCREPGMQLHVSNYGRASEAGNDWTFSNVLQIWVPEDRDFEVSRDYCIN